MQGIIGSFNKNPMQKLPANVDLFNDEEIEDTSDPGHKKDLNPDGSGTESSNTNENEFFGLYINLWLGLIIL